MSDIPFLSCEQHEFIRTHWLPHFIIAAPDAPVEELYARAAKRLHDLDAALAETAQPEPGTNQRRVVPLGDGNDSILLLTASGVIRRPRT